MSSGLLAQLLQNGIETHDYLNRFQAALMAIGPAGELIDVVSDAGEHSDTFLFMRSLSNSECQRTLPDEIGHGHSDSLAFCSKLFSPLWRHGFDPLIASHGLTSLPLTLRGSRGAPLASP